MVWIGAYSNAGGSIKKSAFKKYFINVTTSHSLLYNLMKNNDFDVFFETLLDEFERSVDGVKQLVHSERCVDANMIRKFEVEANSVVAEYRNGKIQVDKYSYWCRECTMDEYVISKTGEARWKGEPDILLAIAFVCRQWGALLYRRGAKAEAHRYVLLALKQINIWTGAYWGLEMEVAKCASVNDKYEASRRGGKNSAKRYNPIKDEVIRLLKKNVPEGGWKSKAAAINSLEQEITKFIDTGPRKNAYYPSWDSLHKTISDWSRNDMDMKKTFAEVVNK